MTGRSLKASAEGIEKATKALNRNNWSKKALAEELEMARSTLSNFFGCKPVDRATFEEICHKLGLDWQEIVDRPPNDPEPAAVEDVTSKNPDFVGNEEVSSNPTSKTVDTLVQEVRQRYHDKIQYQCGTLRMLNVPQPVNVNHLYVDVNILEKPTQSIPLEISQLPQVNPDTGEFDRFGLGKVRQERVSAQTAVNTYLKLMMLGKPGSGKTTFLKHLAIECNKGEFNSDKLPIFIGLKDFAEDACDAGDFSLFNYISQDLESCGVLAEEVETLLRRGRALILLDGLDEVPQAQFKKVLKEIRRFTEQYYQNQLVITCRISAQAYGFDGFTDVQVADFNSEQIEDFVKKWFVAVANNSEQEGRDKAAQFIEKLQLPENQQIRELAVTPILLSLTCLFFQEAADFPSGRAKLYEQGIDILLVRWDEVRGIQRDEIYRNLSVQRKRNLLSQAAAITFEQGDYFFEQGKIQQLIADYLRALPDSKNDPDELQQDSMDVLKAIEAQHGLLVERSLGIYSFSHLTFQEYFTAREIVASSNPKVIRRLLTEKRWREVFLLAGEMSWKANTLLLLKQQIDEFAAKDEEMQQILKWVNQKSCSVKTHHTPVALRAFYLALVRVLGLFLGRIHTNPNSLSRLYHSAGSFVRAASLARKQATDVLDITLDVDLDVVLARIFALDLEPELSQKLQQIQAQMPDPDEDKERFNEWWQAENQAWIEQLKPVRIPELNISYDGHFNKFKGMLKAYYKFNQYLVERLNNSCHVSSEVRTHIEDTLLLPIAEIENRKHSQ
ncbi:MAG TPA: histidine kinase [Cyanobacteria bacterium UBA8543]|nr:histidine kinase [Cyanobacteria bacterium UBA8543]